ncbi:uncharacterized protein B0H18DRAFT_995267 [Fomitopsis serialis]|uniref:uncharacterized protein n=1 Tax=Fomitopsis serialis TaxID=139415 RepID=UPI002007F102|nr:uncharacterized protein B0H18DRAFT_995267 [Neoantrodia serialis]KAH9930111.1 hypothetical protein B0H18DRAFT_995267 [Neoantrodia serialis]
MAPSNKARAPTKQDLLDENAMLKASQQNLSDEMVALKEQLASLTDSLTQERASRAAAEILVESKRNEIQFMKDAAAREAQNAASTARAAAEHGVGRMPANAPSLSARRATGDEVIPKPRGSGGQDYKVRVEMGLANEKSLYLAIMRTIRDLHQNPVVLGKLFRAAEEKHPYLQRFECSWATADLVKQYIRNRRKDAVAKGYMEPRAKRAAAHQQAEAAAVAGSSSASGSADLGDVDDEPEDDGMQCD